MIPCRHIPPEGDFLVWHCADGVYTDQLSYPLSLSQAATNNFPSFSRTLFPQCSA
eukprot:jgi/Botrbrau1/21220/Bobra.39_2s0021.1